MKKVFQVLKAIIIALLICCALAYVLCYIFLKEQTTQFTECLINVLQTPLPIIGISILGLGYIIFKILSLTKFGKKTLIKLKEENDNLRHEIEENNKLLNEYKEMSKNDYNDLKKQIMRTEEYVIQGYEMSRNIKVKQLAQEMRGVENEETNGNTETEEI